MEPKVRVALLAAVVLVTNDLGQSRRRLALKFKTLSPGLVMEDGAVESCPAHCFLWRGCPPYLDPTAGLHLPRRVSPEYAASCDSISPEMWVSAFQELGVGRCGVLPPPEPHLLGAWTVRLWPTATVGEAQILGATPAGVPEEALTAAHDALLQALADRGLFTGDPAAPVDVRVKLTGCACPDLEATIAGVANPEDAAVLAQYLWREWDALLRLPPCTVEWEPSSLCAGESLASLVRCGAPPQSWLRDVPRARNSLGAAFSGVVNIARLRACFLRMLPCSADPSAQSCCSPRPAAKVAPAAPPRGVGVPLGHALR